MLILKLSDTRSQYFRCMVYIHSPSISHFINTLILQLSVTSPNQHHREAEQTVETNDLDREKFHSQVHKKVLNRWLFFSPRALLFTTNR